jgi:hypothetical protein
MKKSLLLSTALLASAMAFSAPARADVTVDGQAEFVKDIEVWERSYSLYLVGIVSYNIFVDSSAAESISVTNQRNDNQVFLFDPRNPDDDGQGAPEFVAPQRNNGFFVATLTGSVTGNTGITQVNQDVGHMVNQSNSVSAAVNMTAFFAESHAIVEQQNNGNQVTQEGVLPTNPDGSVDFDAINANAFALRRANIIDSVNANAGVTQVNQNAGVANNQVNSVSLALSLGSGQGLGTTAVALSEADLGQWNIGGTTHETNTIKVSRIIGSINDNGGITSVNQSSGNMNNQASVISFAGASSIASFSRP